jgi:hypothetical protein
MASAITDFLIRVKVQGQQLVDNLTKSTNDAEKGMNNASKAAGKFSTSIKGLGSSVLGMAGGITGIAAAIAAIGMRAINTADQIQDLADATGISAGSLLNFKQSIIEAGGRTEDFEKISSRLNQTLGEAANGNEKARKSFKDLGISLGDANGNLRSTDDLLPEVLSALSSIEDPATRAATAVDILGKSAARIDWTKVSAGKDAIKDQQIKQLAEYQGAIDKLANSIETSLITAFGKLAIAIDKQGVVMGTTTVMDDYVLRLQYFIIEMTQGKEAADKFYQSLMKFRGKIGTGAVMAPGQVPLSPGTVPSQAGAGRGVVNPAVVSAGGVGDLAITEAGKQQIANAQAQTKAMMATNNEANKYATLLNETIGMQQRAGDIARSNLNIDKERDTKLADINKQIETELNNKERDSRVTAGLVSQLREQGMEVIRQADIMKATKTDELTKLQQQKDLVSDIMLLNQMIAQDTQINQLAGQNELIGLFGDELQLKQGLLAIDNERVNAVIAAENKLRALGKDATNADIARANKEIQQAQSVADTKVKILEDQLAKEKALRENASAGAAQAIESIARSFDPFQQAQMQVNSLFGNMSSAIDNFVDTGKFKFSDFATSVVKDLIKIELKSQATKLLSGVTGFLGGLLGFAEGGQPPVGKPSIVGEKGPELFVPKTAGTIVPNGGSGGGTSGAGGNTYITNNISAVDAKSVAQLFAENRRTLFGTVEMARKEMSYGR